MRQSYSIADIEQILLDLIGSKPEYSLDNDRVHIWKTPGVPIVAVNEMAH